MIVLAATNALRYIKGKKGEMMMIDTPVPFGDTVMMDLLYPGVDGNPSYLQVGLQHVRAADPIRISYDFERDGWRIEQASRFEWEIDEEPDNDWQEVSFIQAWAREKKSAPEDIQRS